MKKKQIKKLSIKDIKVLDKKTMNKVVGGVKPEEILILKYGVCIGTQTV